MRSFFGFTFFNILYFFKYSCTNIFHRRSLYTFYNELGMAWSTMRIDWRMNEVSVIHSCIVNLYGGKWLDHVDSGIDEFSLCDEAITLTNADMKHTFEIWIAIQTLSNKNIIFTVAITLFSSH